MKTLKCIEKEKVIRDVMQRIDTIPALPEAVMKVIKLIDDENTRPRELEKYIGADQALTARMLRLVNSSFFGLTQKVTTIRRAVVLMGYKTLKSLVIAASTSKFLQRQVAGYNYAPGGLWQHSLSCASGCRLLAQILGWDGDVVDEMFVCGLLHDIGKLVLAQHIAGAVDRIRAFMEENDEELNIAEEEILGISHCQVGGKISQKWRFPEELRTIISKHHDPSGAGDSSRQATIVHVVDYLLNQEHIGLGEEEGFVQRLDGSAVHAIQPDKQFWKDFHAELVAGLQEVNQVFGEIQ